MLSRRTVTLAWRPGPLANIHRPPNSHEFRRFYPREILTRRIIEVQNHARSREIQRIVANNNRAPRCRKWQLHISTHAIRQWSNIRLQIAII